MAKNILQQYFIQSPIRYFLFHMPEDDSDGTLVEITSNMTIGRVSEGNDICLPDPSISTQHLKIHLKEDGIYIEDLESSNKTYLNKQEITPYTPIRLLRDDFINIGDQQLLFTYDSTLNTEKAKDLLAKFLLFRKTEEDFVRKYDLHIVLLQEIKLFQEKEKKHYSTQFSPIQGLLNEKITLEEEYQKLQVDKQEIENRMATIVKELKIKQADVNFNKAKELQRILQTIENRKSFIDIEFDTVKKRKEDFLQKQEGHREEEKKLSKLEEDKKKLEEKINSIKKS